MKKETLGLFQEKFMRNCTPEELCFLKEMEIIKGRHKGQAKANRKKYLYGNEKVIKMLSGGKIFKIGISLLGAFVSAIGVSEFIKYCLSFFEKTITEQQNMYLVIAILGIVFAVMSYYIYSLEEKKKELQFRNYGETWIRHKIAEVEMDAEILKYVCGLECYEGELEVKQRKIFMSRMLQIEANNMKLFEENMKKIEAVIK